MIEVEPMSVDQLAGAVVLFLGAVGSLLLVVWQSKCHCRVNLCYIFQCERRPPNEEELKTLADEAKNAKAKTDKMLKKENKILEEEEEILEEVRTPRLVPNQKKPQASSDSPVLRTGNLPSAEPEPEPEPSGVDSLV
jgi:hypothetical protein